MVVIFFLVVLTVFEIDHMAQCDLEETQRCEKISNKSSFGIIDIAEESSTSDRIIVIVDTVRWIDDDAYRWRCGRQTNLVSASH